LQETGKKSLIPRNVLVLTMSRTIWSMSDTNLDNFISAYMLALGATVPAIGLMNALGSFGAMLMYPIGGYIADKSGRVKLVAYSTLLYVSSFVVYLFAPTWQWAAFAMVYQQMVLFYVPAMNAIMADSIPVGDRGKLFGFNFALPNLIRIISPYIGGLFIAHFELIPAMRIGFTISLTIGLIVTAMRLFFLRETIDQVEEVDWNPYRLVKAAYKDMDVSIRWIYHNIRSYAGATMLLSFLSSMILPFWIIYVVKEIGLDPYLWSVILLWSGVAKAVLSLFIGGIVDRLGARNCFIMGLLISIPGMYMFTFAEGFRTTLLIYTTIVLGAVLQYPQGDEGQGDGRARERNNSGRHWRRVPHGVPRLLPKDNGQPSGRLHLCAPAQRPMDPSERAPGRGPRLPLVHAQEPGEGRGVSNPYMRSLSSLRRVISPLTGQEVREGC